MSSKQVGPEGRVVSGVEEIDFKNKLVLFNNRICPFGHRAWWASKEKGVSVDYIHIDLGDTKPTFYTEKINSSGTVPCIFDNGVAIFESVECALYLDEKFPDIGNRLMPADAYDRYRVRLVLKTFEKLMKPLYGLLMNQEPEGDKELVGKINDAAKELNAEFRKSKGPYFLGETFSLADLAIIPFVDRFSVTLPHWRGFQPFSQDNPDVDALLASYHACQQRPAFKSTSQDPEFYSKSYQRYAQTKRIISSL
eukprot:CAMPEP_0203746844 /NCGR_PEP_ID=MMETSP0098-20131031/2169_1 /ASSEMBLY_ACC=CAM_ASM_000208 /TAXON_ID=96639 /ORGANISM=" , Strain NY0313808BC1" /LENGTH=251 /DNA_ID=CAMNT_0050635091 /DNA_START=74 /DNA_END=829 /DNA_ORIENTATION=-